MRSRRIFIAALVTVSLSACGAGTGGSTAGSGPRNQLTQEQMVAVNAGTVYDAVRRLRPEWLRVRGSTSTRSDPGSAGPLVYVDGVRSGDIERLRQISVTTVTRVRYVSPSDATTRWGTGHTAGVIEVLTR